MTPLERAKLSLEGLSVGDALGERFFGSPAQVAVKIAARNLPDAPWRYTDDTEMALSIVEILEQYDGIESDALARAFARRYTPNRGYGGGAHQLIQKLQLGEHWKTASKSLFGGSGSFGNGAAMRAAPIGAYFADDLQRVVYHAHQSALVTHAHAEGIAGAIAVAVAAALAWQGRQEGQQLDPAAFLTEVAQHTPRSSDVQYRLLEVAELEPPLFDSIRVALLVGCGQMVSAQDTVPFALWCAAHHLHSFEEAFWATVCALGDRDTTCAIVGGIVVLSDSSALPQPWLEAREVLPTS